VHGSPFYIHNVNFTTGDDNVAGHANHTLVEDSYFGCVCVCVCVCGVVLLSDLLSL
jgi:hypothetical protein